MAVYHFSWDLGHFGFHDMDVAGDLGWRIFARLIAGTFLFLVGASLVLAHGEGVRWRAFWRRVADRSCRGCRGLRGDLVRVPPVLRPLRDTPSHRARQYFGAALPATAAGVGRRLGCAGFSCPGNGDQGRLLGRPRWSGSGCRRRRHRPPTMCPCSRISGWCWPAWPLHASCVAVRRPCSSLPAQMPVRRGGLRHGPAATVWRSISFTSRFCSVSSIRRRWRFRNRAGLPPSMQRRSSPVAGPNAIRTVVAQSCAARSAHVRPARSARGTCGRP